MSSAPSGPAARWRRPHCTRGCPRSAAGAKRPNGSATSCAGSCSPSGGEKKSTRRPRSSRVGGSLGPLLEEPRSPQKPSEAGAAERRGARCGVEYSEDDREVTMEREEAELRALQQEEASLRAANERIATMAEELRKAELVRDRLEGLARLMGSYPEGHDMRERLEALDVERALEGVNEDIRIMTNTLMYPGGT